MKRSTQTSLVLVAAIVFMLAGVVRYYFSLGTYLPEANPSPSIELVAEPIIAVQDHIVEETVVENEQPIANSPDKTPFDLVRNIEENVKLKKPFEFWHDAQEILRASVRAEDLVVAALYDLMVDTELGGNNIELAEESLFRAYHLDYTNPLVNHQIMILCGRVQESTLCSFPYADNLRQVDGDNAILLNELSIVYYQNFDFNQALYLLNRAAVVEKSDNYYGRYIEAINNAFTYNRIRFLRTRQNLSLYPKLASSTVNANFSSIIKMCDERVGLQLEQWRISCRDAGKNVADLSTNSLGESYGVRQYVRYAGLNLEDQHVAIRAVANLRAKVVGDMEANEDISNTRIPHRVWEAFITDLRDKGEADAYANLEEKMSVFRKRRY